LDIIYQTTAPTPTIKPTKEKAPIMMYKCMELDTSVSKPYAYAADEDSGYGSQATKYIGRGPPMREEVEVQSNPMGPPTRLQVGTCNLLSPSVPPQ